MPETLTITVRAPPTAIEHDWQEPTVNNWVTWESIPDIIAVRTLLGVGVDITVNNETELILPLGVCSMVVQFVILRYMHPIGLVAGVNVLINISMG